MNVEEIAAAASAAIQQRAKFHAEHPDLFDSPAQLVLTLSRDAAGNTIRLFGRHGGPRGEVLCSPADGETTAAFDAQAVLDWIAARVGPAKG